MSETVTVYATESAEIRSWDPLFNDHESAEVVVYPDYSTGERQENALLVHFDVPAEYLYRTINNMRLMLYGISTSTAKGSTCINVLDSAVDFSIVTWANSPSWAWAFGAGGGTIRSFFPGLVDSAAYVEADRLFTPTYIYYLRRAALFGISITYYANGSRISTAISEHKPYIELTFGSGQCSIEPTNLTPAAGSSCPRGAKTTFSFAAKANAENISIAIPVPAASKFRWRVKGETSYTEVDIGSAYSYTMPANTMPKGAVEYQFEVTDSGGSVSTSSWVEISTLDTVSTAAPVSPDGTIVDTTNAVAFSWTHINASGAPQSKAELQISADNAEWTALATVTGADTETVIPAGTIASGSWYWRVRTYNQDDVAGAWSASAQFQAVGSPPAPVLQIEDNSPRPIIAWQTNEQEAWELTIAGETITGYGTAKRWQSPWYFAPGDYSVSVRTQNSYGIWGEKSTLVFTVTNTPGGSIQLTAQGEGAAVRLTWNAGGYDYYLVYRDDVAIARVTETEYLDYLSCGLCTYKVRGCYAASNNYGISDPVIVEVYPRCPVIIDVETRAALWLELSEQQHRTYSMTRARQSTSYHIVGQARPSVDVSEFLDETLTVSAAFWADDRAGMRQLEALLGRVVCLKTDSGEMSVGVLTSTTKTVDMFYTSYQLAVTNTEFEEAVRE